MGLFDIFKRKHTSSLITQDGNITLIHDGKTNIIGIGHPNHAEILEALKNNQLDRLNDLVDVPAVIERSFENVTVRDGQVFYEDEPVHNVVASRIIEFMRTGEDFQPLALFLNKLMNNPSKRAVDELYNWLEQHLMAITPEGNFIAYKGLREDYMDCHSNTFDNSPGKTLSVPRREVDDDARVACSYGLHVGSYEYAADFAQGKLVTVEVDPANVVSVPFDGANKIRVTGYTVLKDTERVESQPVYRAPQEPCDEPQERDIDAEAAGHGYRYNDNTGRWMDAQGTMVAAAAVMEIIGFSTPEDEDECCSECGEHYDDCYCDEYDSDSQW